ncbi:hypothetical protein GCM10017687_51000 [Streptomyces echinatus]
MPRPPAPRKTTGRPARISREEIIRTARRIVTEDGADRLTMRRLATEIGSTPMALYHHVRDKEELLLLLLDDHAARSLRRPEPPPADPRDRVLAAATAIHEVLAACPWIVEVLTADDLMSTSALWFVEQIVAGLTESGLSLDEAVRGYRTIWYYTAGEILVHATSARRRSTDDRPHLPRPGLRRPRPGRTPPPVPGRPPLDPPHGGGHLRTGPAGAADRAPEPHPGIALRHASGPR